MTPEIVKAEADVINETLAYVSHLEIDDVYIPDDIYLKNVIDAVNKLRIVYDKAA